MITYEIKEYVEGSTVEVTFTQEESGIEHTRTVNVVLSDGEYDEELTIKRVEEVGRGVEHKISCGVISASNEPVPELVPLEPTE